MTSIKSRTFKHYGLWTRFCLNTTNLIRITNESQSSQCIDLANLLAQVLEGHNFVPSNLFVEGTTRASSIEIPNMLVSKRLPIFPQSKLVQEGVEIRERTGKSRHYCVLQQILKNDINALCMELPVWNHSFFHNGQFKPVVGHIDLIRFENNKLQILDYKPDNDPHVVQQLLTYKELMLRLLYHSKPEDVELLWFNNEEEFKLEEKELDIQWETKENENHPYQI